METTDIPAALRERVTCSISAAAKYGIPASILLAVAQKEGGRPGLHVANKNGTSDVGPMQFNTAYLSTLARYGITAAAVAAAGCYSYELAAWRLRQHLLHDSGDVWTRAANYHSRTPIHNAVYRRDLIEKEKWWAAWLRAKQNTTGLSPATKSTTAGELRRIDASLKIPFQTSFVGRAITASESTVRHGRHP